MENNNELSREEYKRKIQQEREDNRRLNEIKEKIRKNRIQEEKKKKRIIKFVKGFIGVAALSISLALFRWFAQRQEHYFLLCKK